MKKLKSKNIIRFLDVHETKSNYYIMLELANDGNFRDILQNKKCLSEK
jgi:serine/threonine protein kinase